MAQRGIREYDAKRLLAKFLPQFISGEFSYSGKVAFVGQETDMDKLKSENPWLAEDRLVVKPDQLFGKRGKNNLLMLDKSFDEAKSFIASKMNQEVTVGKTTGKLTHFLIEPFVPHDEEYYIAIKSERDGDAIYFSTQGGINVEENWDKVITIKVPTLTMPTEEGIRSKLPDTIESGKAAKIAMFASALFRFYAEFGFTYLEINPFAMVGNNIMPLDLVAKVDDTAAFECSGKWDNLEFPPPFGRMLSKEEEYISGLDELTGASLKLTVLNQKGRIWTLVAGGGASVIYADTICDLGFGNEMANYGEYSGNPNTEFTYKYAKTVLDLMLREKDERGKVLLIGGGIANFTDVAKTFTGIIMALKEYAARLKENNVKILVRRGGPNYKKGLEQIKKTGKDLGLDIEVYGPETHMTRIVSIALGNEKSADSKC